MNLPEANENIDCLCSFIEEQQALAKIFPTDNSEVDLEEDSDPYYLITGSGIPGSTLDTNLNDHEEYEDSAKNIGMKVCEVGYNG